MSNSYLSFLERQKTYRFKLRKRYKRLNKWSLYNAVFLRFQNGKYWRYVTISFWPFQNGQKYTDSNGGNVTKSGYIDVL